MRTSCCSGRSERGGRRDRADIGCGGAHRVSAQRSNRRNHSSARARAWRAVGDPGRRRGASVARWENAGAACTPAVRGDRARRALGRLARSRGRSTMRRETNSGRDRCVRRFVREAPRAQSHDIGRGRHPEVGPGAEGHPGLMVTGSRRGRTRCDARFGRSPSPR